METNKLVFLVESNSNTGMTRQHSRSLGGERVVDYTPDVRFERITMLFSVSAKGNIVSCIFAGSLNGDFFVEYITKFLAPTLKLGDIVVMDNLSSHKVKGVAEAINAVGAKVLYRHHIVHI